jgi:hypothetical protein
MRWKLTARPLYPQAHIHQLIPLPPHSPLLLILLLDARMHVRDFRPPPLRDAMRCDATTESLA